MPVGVRSALAITGVKFDLRDSRRRRNGIDRNGLDHGGFLRAPRDLVSHQGGAGRAEGPDRDQPAVRGDDGGAASWVGALDCGVYWMSSVTGKWSDASINADFRGRAESF